MPIGAVQRSIIDPIASGTMTELSRGTPTKSGNHVSHRQSTLGSWKIKQNGWSHAPCQAVKYC